MFKVLIVDDELYAIKGVVDGVDWERLNVSEVREARHAREARAVLNSENIDIMICDIEMPEESGLDLVEWAKVHYPEMQTVFLTCHADFSYAKHAIHLGSCDYLLKPVIYEELESVLERILESIYNKRNESERNERFRKYYQLWHHQKPQIINLFWKDVISTGSDKNTEKLRQATKHYELPFSEDTRLSLVLISVEEWGMLLGEFDEGLMGFAIRNVAEEIIIGQHAGHVIDVEDGNSLVIIYVREENIERGQLEQCCEAFANACGKYLSCKIWCYIGETVEFNNVTESYHKLIEMKKERLQANNIVYKLQSYIRDNLNQQLTRDNLSAYVHLNPSYLSRMFHKETGMHLSYYILRERMKKAAELLAATDETISGIANMVGYDNFSYFSKMFKEVYGMTPQEYRKK